MPTLITGAGLLGSGIAAHLAASGASPVLYGRSFPDVHDGVTCAKGDVLDGDALTKILREHRIDTVVHTAALLARGVRERPLEGVRTNILGTVTAVQAAHAAGVRRFVFCGSTAIMGGLTHSPGAVPEDFSLHVQSEPPPSLYSTTKLSAEWLALALTRQLGMTCVALRFGGIFGPWKGTATSGQGYLAQRVVEAAITGEAVSLSHEDLLRPLNYLYISDAVSAVAAVLAKPNLSESVYNIAAARNHSGAELVAITEAACGHTISVTATGEPPASIRGTLTVDISRAKRDFGWTELLPLELSLPKYLAACSGSAGTRPSRWDRARGEPREQALNGGTPPR